MKSEEEKEIQEAIKLFLKYGPIAFVVILGVISLIGAIINPTADRIGAFLVFSVATAVVIVLYRICVPD